MRENGEVNVNKLLGKEELISLMSIYLSEWEHRDDVLWRQVFKFYYNIFAFFITLIANII